MMSRGSRQRPSHCRQTEAVAISGGVSACLRDEAIHVPLQEIPVGDPRDFREDLRLGHPLRLGRLDDESPGADPHRYRDADDEPSALEPGALEPQQQGGTGIVFPSWSRTVRAP